MVELPAPPSVGSGIPIHHKNAGALRLAILASVGVHTVLLGTALALTVPGAQDDANRYHEDHSHQFTVTLANAAPASEAAVDSHPTVEPPPKKSPQQLELDVIPYSSVSPLLKRAETPPEPVEETPDESVAETFERSFQFPKEIQQQKESVASTESKTSGDSKTATSKTKTTGKSGRSGGVSLVRKIPPQFPESAREKGQEGTVVFLAMISTEGKVSTLRIERSSGTAILDKAAEKAVKQWVFTPAMTDGIPSESTVRIPVSFLLKDT